MFEMRMTVVVVVVPAIYSYAIFGDKNYSSAQIIHIIPFAIQVSTYIKCTFLSNKIVQKISFSLCFWASDHLIDKSN